MAKLKDYQGRYCESDYENAFLALLEKAGWTYSLWSFCAIPARS